jgi:hypothetical protein
MGSIEVPLDRSNQDSELIQVSQIAIYFDVAALEKWEKQKRGTKGSR